MDEHERPEWVDLAARCLGRNPADVIAYADHEAESEVVLVFRQGWKQRVSHAVVEAYAASLAPAPEAQPEPKGQEDSSDAGQEPVDESGVSAETLDPPLEPEVEPDPAADLEQPAKPKPRRSR